MFQFIDLKTGERVNKDEAGEGFAPVKFYCKERLTNWRKLQNMADYLALRVRAEGAGVRDCVALGVQSGRG